MGVYAVVGVPGAGKSLYLVQTVIIPALKKGRKVYTNIEGLDSYRIAGTYDLDPTSVLINLTVWSPEDSDRIRAFYYSDPVISEKQDEKPSKFGQVSLNKKHIEPRTDASGKPIYLENNCLIVIDEAQNYFGARDWDKAESRELIPYLTRHRHYGHDVYVATQAIDSIDITFRRLISLTYAIKRMEHFGLKSSSMIYVFDRSDLERAPLMRKRWGFDTKIFSLYKSYDQSDVKENRKSVNVLLRSPLFLFFVFVVVACIFQVWRTGGPTKAIVKQEKKTEKTDQKLTENTKPKTEIPPCWISHTIINGQGFYVLEDGSNSLVAGYRCNR